MATLDQLWEELLTAGLVGTDRRPYAPPPDGPVRLLTSLYCDEPAHTWLAAAGALAVLRLAGGMPTRLPLADAEPSLADDWPRCRPAAARHLAQMLAGQFDECLPEWLATAAATGQRVPEEQLPELLDWAYMRHDLKPHLVAVIGARGRWLARQNDRWAYAAPPATALGGFDEMLDAWELAAGLERLALLKQVRATDPTEALSLVQHAWPQAKHDDRLAFVRQLAVGLSHADEPFLESVLDERSSTLRQAAARLLGRLPGSRLCQRMLQRTRSLLRLEGGPRGTRKRSAAAGPSLRLAVFLPETCDAAMQRDGLTPNAVAGQADQARWLAQMLAAVPPAEWSRLLGLSPTELVGLARAHILDFALIQGWATAAAAFGDAEWAEALLRERLPELDTAALRPLLGTLPPRRREALVAGALKNIERLAQRQPAVRLLQAYAEPWSPRLTLLFVDKVREEVGRRDVPFGPPVEFGWLASLALYWDHDVFGEAAPPLRQAGQAARQPGTWINWLPTLERALDLWQFRHDLHEELAR